MKRVLFILLSLIFNVGLNSSTLAEEVDANPPPVILSGVIEGTEPIKAMKKLQREKIHLPDMASNSYKLSADVSFKIEKQKTLLDQLQFKIDENLHNGAEQVRYLFSGQNNPDFKTVELNFLPDLQNFEDSYNDQQDATIDDYDELWIEYQDLFDDNPTQVSFSLLVESEIESSSAPEKFYYLLQTSNHIDPLVELEVEDVSKAIWQPKDQLYLFKRFFDLERDDNWRYLQEDGHVVLQRRFDRTLSEIEAVDVVLDTYHKLEGVNLRLETENGDEIIIEWDSIPKQISKEGDDNLRVRILLNELLKLHNRFILKEIVIFLTGTVDEITRNRPVHSLHWMGKRCRYDYKTTCRSSTGNQSDQVLMIADGDIDNFEVISIVSQVESLGDGNKRLKADLTNVLRKDGWNSKVVSMKLLLEPRPKINLAGIELSKIRLVSLYKNTVPTIALQGRELLKLWGVELDSIANYSESNIWPVIYKYSNIQQKPINLDPQGRWVDLEWKIGREISEGSYLYLGGKENQKDNKATPGNTKKKKKTDDKLKIERVEEKGIQDKVLGIQATPYSFSGENLGNWFLKLNESVQLDKFRGNHERVDYIKIRVYLDAPSGNKSPITEMALFVIDNLSFREILDTPFPFQQETSLDLEIENKPSNIIISKAQDGTTTFFKLDDEPSHGDLFFNTVIDNKNRSEDDSLVVSYEVPWIFPLIDECWLEMTAIGGKKEIQNKICLDGSSDKKSVPLPVWVDQIKWRAILPYENNMWSNSDRYRFSLSIKLLTTTRDQLVSQPILAINSNKLPPVDAKFNKYRDNLYFDIGDIKYSTYFDDIKHLEHPFDIGDIKYSTYFDDIKHLEHPWLEVDKIIFEREEPFSIEEWEVLNNEELIEDGDRLLRFWLQLLKYLSIIIAIWWLIKSFRSLAALFLSLWNLPVRALSRSNIEVSWGAAFLWWSIVTLSLYSRGMQEENYYFTIGGMAVVLTWRALVEYCKPIVESYWPGLSKKVYSGAGTKYFSGFIVAIVGVTVMLMFRLEPIAEQFAVIGFYLLVVGVALEILDLRKDKPNINQEGSIDK